MVRLVIEPAVLPLVCGRGGRVFHNFAFALALVPNPYKCRLSPLIGPDRAFPDLERKEGGESSSPAVQRDGLTAT